MMSTSTADSGSSSQAAATVTPQDDDTLTAEQREARDAAAAEKERLEQAALPYKWRQTLQDVDIILPVPKGKRAKEFEVKIDKMKLSVKVRGGEVLMEGDFPKAIQTEESTWSLDSKLGEIHLHLEKHNTVEWWAHVLTKDPKVDTSKIVPENSKLSDLDGETRAMVEKMMFDQNQKARGLPSSDEMEKMKMLEKFKAQHPELDFSKAKMSF